MIGRTISHYKITEKLGEGGMGVVYKAEDIKLDRFVALKFLPPQHSDKESRQRFIQEARAASALDHPNLCTVHEIAATDEGQMFIAMAYYEGGTLQEKMEGGGVETQEALDLGVQICNGLAKAHAEGITHRDVKPSNIMVTRDGLVKILDFGLAKLAGATKITKTGSTMGTPQYMSPEQVEGKDADPRSDIWSVGAILYEMLTGQAPFKGGYEAEVYYSILHEKPEPLTRLQPDLPPGFQRIVDRTLAKNRDERSTSAAELAEELSALQRELAGPGSAPDLRRSLSDQLRKPRFAIPALAAVLALAAALSWLWVRNSRIDWARNVALPEVQRLVEELKPVAAWRLALQAERHIPDDLLLQQLIEDVTWVVSIETTPPGAEVYWRDGLATVEDSEWELLGTSPIENRRVPIGFLRLRLTKDGFTTKEVARLLRPGLTRFTLFETGSSEPGMVRVLGDSYSYGRLDAVELQDYWIDQYEVRNKDFKRFIDAGGYQKAEHWRHPFFKEGETVTWEDAVADFRDATGRPGPSTWELGSHPDERADFPVSGVSWYEAAAYCESVEKTLPTVYHWDKAAGSRNLGMVDITQISNFNLDGPVEAGAYQGMGPYGTFDMAGNVKEWCWNQSGKEHYILGGAWGEPHYMFTNANTMPPFDRSATHGFRCAKYASPPAATITSAIEKVYRDYSAETPIGDEIFESFRSLYAYDRGPLNAVVESVDDSSQYWTKETVFFDAAYGGDRVAGYLYLPKDGIPPYQTVVYFPGSSALRRRTSERLGEIFYDFVIRSGRALFFPVYQDMFERRVTTTSRGANFQRDRVIAWSKDLGRSIDYLETRKEIDTEKLAYYGVSSGARWGPLLTAMEERLKASVLLAGGLGVGRALPDEADLINFVPRARIPVLMLNGRYDSTFPVKTSQLPMFRLLGTPEQDKRHALFESGHVPPRREFIKETLDWLDRYLGSVEH